MSHLPTAEGRQPQRGGQPVSSRNWIQIRGPLPRSSGPPRYSATTLLTTDWSSKVSRIPKGGGSREAQPERGVVVLLGPGALGSGGGEVAGQILPG